jgi:hypothetical protein
MHRIAKLLGCAAIAANPEPIAAALAGVSHAPVKTFEFSRCLIAPTVREIDSGQVQTRLELQERHLICTFMTVFAETFPLKNPTNEPT